MQIICIEGNNQIRTSMESTNKESTVKLDEDEILEMFFDESFVPQAFVDILLSNSKSDINQVKTVSSSLLSRLDFYTKHLTSELETKIWNLEKLSETLPGTWSSSISKSSDNPISSSVSNSTGVSKLEYYLDTLANAVRALETDVSKIETQLKDLDVEYKNNSDVTVRLRKLQLVKERLLNTQNIFKKIKTIVSISDIDGNKSESKLIGVSITNFELSLKTLEQTIGQSLKDSLSKEKGDERNSQLLKKIDDYSELVSVFKGFDSFYNSYKVFAESIEEESKNYLKSKDIDVSELAS